MRRELPFVPYPFLGNPHVQTICNGMVNFFPNPISERKIIHLSDGDRVSVEITTPTSWKENDWTVVLVHGLGGSHLSPNVLRMASKLSKQGIRAIRYNMRGCGSGRGLSRSSYHSGRSDDLFEALQKIKQEHPKSPILLIGFSLGGNIVLKLAGELGALGGNFIEGVLAASPPIDLFASIQMFLEPHNRFIHRYFCNLLREEVVIRHEVNKDLPWIDIPRDVSLYEFDQIYTAPFCGFKSAEDYYAKCSSMHYIPDIDVPCKIIFSEDDPIISSTAIDNVEIPSHVEVYKTKKGGHMAYLGHPVNGRGFYWLDSLLLEWTREILS